MRLLFSAGLDKLCAVEAASIKLTPVYGHEKEYYVTVHDLNEKEYSVRGVMGYWFQRDEANLIVKKLYETGCFMEGCAKENYE